MLGGVDHDIHNTYHDLPMASIVKSLGQRRFSALNSFITQASINQKYFLLWSRWNYITLPRPYTMADEALWHLPNTLLNQWIAGGEE